MELIEKEDICLIIQNKERKHLIIVKQYPMVDSEFDLVQIKEDYERDFRERTRH